MSEQHLRFALFGNEYQVKKSVAVERTISYLHAHDAEIYIDRPYYEFLQRQTGGSVVCSGVFDDYNFDVDFAISLGGDGTFLRAANRVAAKGIPVLGVNMGRLGFLADVLPAEVEKALDEIYAGLYKTEEHTAIQIEADGEPIEGSPFALNDIALLKRADAAMIARALQCRRRVSRHLPGRRAHRLHADRLHGLQPLQRWPYHRALCRHPLSHARGAS